jgi:hypothetical protein
LRRCHANRIQDKFVARKSRQIHKLHQSLQTMIRTGVVLASSCFLICDLSVERTNVVNETTSRTIQQSVVHLFVQQWRCVETGTTTTMIDHHCGSFFILFSRTVRQPQDYGRFKSALLSLSRQPEFFVVLFPTRWITQDFVRLLYAIHKVCVACTRFVRMVTKD